MSHPIEPDPLSNMHPLHASPESHHDHPPQQEVPVYNLHVFIKHIEEQASWRARTANMLLADELATTQRKALKQLCDRAKQLIADSLAHHRPIPWIAPPIPPEAGDSLVIVAVHL